MLSVREVTTAYQGLVAIADVSIDLAPGDLDADRRDRDQSLIGGGDFMHRQHDDPQGRR